MWVVDDAAAGLLSDAGRYAASVVGYTTSTALVGEAIALAITARFQRPAGTSGGTSTSVVTSVLPVATPMLEKPNVRRYLGVGLLPGGAADADDLAAGQQDRGRVEGGQVPLG